MAQRARAQSDPSSKLLSNIHKAETQTNQDLFSIELKNTTDVDKEKKDEENELKREELDEEYENHIKLPCYYYLIKILLLISILIENGSAVILLNTELYKEADIFWVMCSFAILSASFNNYRWIVLCEIIQTILFVYFSHWTNSSLYTFIPICFFQMICHLFLDSMNNDNFAENGQRERSELKKTMATYGQTITSVILLYFDDSAPFLSIYYQFGLTFMIWMGSLQSEINVYFTKYKKYFNPKLFYHGMIALFWICNLGCVYIWAVLNFVLCIIYLSQNDITKMNDYELGYTIFMLIGYGCISLCFCCCLVCSMFASQ